MAQAKDFKRTLVGTGLEAKLTKAKEAKIDRYYAFSQNYTTARLDQDIALAIVLKFANGFAAASTELPWNHLHLVAMLKLSRIFGSEMNVENPKSQMTGARIGVTLRRFNHYQPKGHKSPPEVLKISMQLEETLPRGQICSV